MKHLLFPTPQTDAFRGRTVYDKILYAHMLQAIYELEREAHDAKNKPRPNHSVTVRGLWDRLFHPKVCCVKATLDGASYIVPIEELQSVMDEVLMLHDAQVGELTIDVIWLTQAELDVMPEFQGF